MLILSRKCTETIVLKHAVTGETITLEQREVRGTISRIGITAAAHWKIIRGELLAVDDPSHQDFGEDYA